MFGFDIGKKFVFDLLLDQQVRDLIKRVFGGGGLSEAERSRIEADRLRAESERRGIQERITGIDVAVADLQMQLASIRAKLDSTEQAIAGLAQSSASTHKQLLLWIRISVGVSALSAALMVWILLRR